MWPTRSPRATRSRIFRACSPASSRGSTRTSTKLTSRPTTISAWRSRRWACSMRPSASCRRHCGRRKGGSAARRRWACASWRRVPTWWRSRSCGARSSCPPRATRTGSASSTGSAGRSRSRASGPRRGSCTGACSRWMSASWTSARAAKPSRRRSDVSQQIARASLSDVQQPVAEELERVALELRRIIAADFPIAAEVNAHLLRMKGKLFRPTLMLLAHQAAGAADPRVVTLAAVVELIHLATLVHDDSVDHSALRRGMPTINALFSHQVAVIMGDYLYSRAIIELVGLEDLEPLRVFARVTNEMTVGEMRQLEAHDKLAYDEAQYDALIRAKTASLLSGACEVWELRAARGRRETLGRFGMSLGMAFQITDDLLDYTQPQAVTGKPSGLDLKEHKVTLPLIAALGRMPAADRRLVEQLMASPDPPDELVADVIRAVDVAEGLEYARRRAQEFAEQAEAELETLPSTPARDALRDSIAYAVERHS